MKQLSPLVSLLAVCLFGLAGCGGSPQSLRPAPASAAQPSASPAPSAGAGAAPASAPAASSAPSSSAPSTASGPGSAPPAASSGAPIAPQDGGGSNLPAVPGNAVVFNQIQNTTDNWQACSLCAQGTNDTDNFWMAPYTTSPSMTGSSRELYVGGPQWTNALFIKTLPAHSEAHHFLWDFWVYFDPTSAAKAWTAEYDFWQSDGGEEFMIGSQCNFGDGWWDTWDSKNNQWLHTTIRCERFSPQQWHHIQWYGERPDSMHYRYVWLVVDGKSYWIDQTYQVNPTNWPDAMGVQWQLDQDISGHDLHEWIDNVKLSVW
jgi:hypothetical protein